jgi:hypothetical protein
MHVLDVADAGSPRVAAIAATEDHRVPMAQVMGVAISGDHVFVGGGVAGLLVYRYPGM